MLLLGWFKQHEALHWFCPEAEAVPQDLTTLGIAVAAAMIRERKITSEALIRALIAKANKSKSLNAFITLDEAAAIKAAKKADAMTAAGESCGPLHGIPIAIKDNIEVVGMPNTAGTPALMYYIPKSNAPVVQKLVDAGAIMFGKTNLHELAFGTTTVNATFGAAGNPYDPKRFAGGSSGGSAAAVSARIAPGSLATDTVGSIRIPAAFCGVVGLRPTVGRYPGGGVAPVSYTFDTSGPIARSVSDIAILDHVIAGGAPIEPAVLSELRLGVPREYFYEGVDPEIARVTEAALAKLKAAGVAIVEVDLPGAADVLNGIAVPITMYEAMCDLPHYLDASKTGVSMEELVAKIASPDVGDPFASMFTGEKAVPPDIYREAMAGREKHRKNMAQYFADNKLSGMIVPATPALAGLIEDELKELELKVQRVSASKFFLRNTIVTSTAGTPGLILPAGLTNDGLPVSLELDGPEGSDRRLLSIGLAMEELFGTLPAPI